ncbi:hypothetical protein KN825_15835, partial [Weizmannia coagulans]|nr:hypothetical protein [Heyndrickxia coagulans]
ILNLVFLNPFRKAKKNKNDSLLFWIGYIPSLDCIISQNTQYPKTSLLFSIEKKKPNELQK